MRPPLRRRLDVLTDDVRRPLGDWRRCSVRAYETKLGFDVDGAKDLGHGRGGDFGRWRREGRWT